VNGEWLEDKALRWLRFNPCVAVREYRRRMVKAGPAATLLGWIWVALTWMWLIIGLGSRLAPSGLRAAQDTRDSFAVLVYVQLVLVMTVLPAYAAGGIGIEKEQRSLEMLRITLLTPRDVVTGKYVMALAFGGVLLLGPLPATAWCLASGGVGLGEVFLVYTFLAAVTASIAALGLCCAAHLSSYIGALVVTYTALFTCAGGGPFIVLNLLMEPSSYPLVTTRIGTWLAGTGGLLLLSFLLWLSAVRAFGKQDAVLSRYWKWYW